MHPVEMARWTSDSKGNHDLDRADSVVGARAILENAVADRTDLNDLSFLTGRDVDGEHGLLRCIEVNEIVSAPSFVRLRVAARSVKKMK
jgi:hypothetical protein